MRPAIPLLLLLTLLALPLRGGAGPINYEYHRVDTSAAIGLFVPPPGYGPPQYVVATGTPFSAELARSIADSHPLFNGSAPSPWDADLLALGTLDNYAFLTGGLVQFLDGASQLAQDLLPALLADLAAAYPGVSFSGTPVQEFVDKRGYELSGGLVHVLPDGTEQVVCTDFGDPSCASQFDPSLPGSWTVVFGDAAVDFYRVTLQASTSPAAVPEPATLYLLALGMLGLVLRCVCQPSR